MFNLIFNEFTNKERTSNNDFNDDIIRPNFHIKSHSKRNLSFNSGLNFMNNFSLNFNDNNYLINENDSLINSYNNFNTNISNNDSIKNDITESNDIINVENNKKKINNKPTNEKVNI